jgi:hypothetical protein
MPKQYGSEAQPPLPPNKSPPLSNKDIKYVQQVIGSILYYTHAVNLTVLMVLSTIASKQAEGMENTMLKTKQLLDYLIMYPDATVQFHASDMILNIHLDASYLSEANTHRRACGHFFMGWKPGPTGPIKSNCVFFTICPILRFVVASVTEQNLLLSSSTANKQQYFDSHSRKWSTHSPPCPYIAKTQPLLEVQTTP